MDELNPRESVGDHGGRVVTPDRGVLELMHVSAIHGAQVLKGELRDLNETASFEIEPSTVQHDHILSGPRVISHGLEIMRRQQVI